MTRTLPERPVRITLWPPHAKRILGSSQRMRIGPRLKSPASSRGPTTIRTCCRSCDGGKQKKRPPFGGPFPTGELHAQPIYRRPHHRLSTACSGGELLTTRELRAVITLASC